MEHINGIIGDLQLSFNLSAVAPTVAVLTRLRWSSLEVKVYCINPSYFKLVRLKMYKEHVSLLSHGQLAPNVSVIPCVLFVIIHSWY